MTTDSEQPIQPRGKLAGSNALEAWHYAGFRRYLLLQISMMGGRALQMAVIGFIVYEMTDSNLLLGIISFMQTVPTLVLAPLVGVIVDRVDRRRVLSLQIAVQAIGFVVLGLLAMFDVLTVPAIGAVVVVLGIANAFAFPAHSSLMPSLVPIRALQSAFSMHSFLGNIARMGFPPLVGVLLDVSGIVAALLFTAGIYAPAAVLILFIPLLAAPAALSSAHGALEEAKAPSVIGDMRDAVDYIRANPQLRAAIANDVAPSLFGLAHMALLPAVASDTLDGGAAVLGLLFTISGAGALIGTLAAGALAGRGLRGATIWISMIGFGIGLLTVAVGSSYAPILFGLFLVGFFQQTYFIQSDTLVQTFAEDRFRGRAVAAQAMVNGLMPVGFLLLGALAQFVSLSAAFAVAGFALVAAGVITKLFRPIIANLR